jgi:diguanylate cyclase
LPTGSRRNGRPGPVAVLYIDVDRLKSIDDYLGYCAGGYR